MQTSYLCYKNDLPDNLIIEGDIAVDTEAMGLNYNRDRLCLIQIADSLGQVYLVHFKDRDYSAKNLLRILTNPATIKIFHYARFDLAMIYKYLGVALKNIFCTKIASKLCRTYSHYHSLAELCMEFLNVKISKNQQTSDWGALRLTHEQLKYAVNDVLYLHRLRDLLLIKLQREKRLNIAIECFRFLPFKVKLDLLGWGNHDIFSHVHDKNII